MSYTVNEIANSSGVFSSFFEGAPAINNDGTVTWQALLDSGGSGIYTGNPLSTVAETPDFSKLGFSTINDNGQVAFYGEKSGNPGIYRRSKYSAAPTVVAAKDQVLTDVNRPEKFTSFLRDPAINNRGQVAFLAGLTGNNSGLFVGNDNGKIKRIADTVGTFGNLKFANLLGTSFEGDVAPSINKEGDIVFWGALDKKLPKDAPEYTKIIGLDPNNPNEDVMPGNVRGIFLKSGDSGKIKTIADNTGKYLSFNGSPDINKDGDVAYIFRGDSLNNVNTSARGINLYENGKTTTIVDNDDHYGKDGYDDVDKFYRFGFVDINDKNTIAFSAFFDPLGPLTGTEDPKVSPPLGVFTAHRTHRGGLDIDKVVAVGDTITIGNSSKKVNDLFFYNNEGFNNQGQLAFSLAFDDGTQGIYRADQFNSY